MLFLTTGVLRTFNETPWTVKLLDSTAGPVSAVAHGLCPSRGSTKVSQPTS